MVWNVEYYHARPKEVDHGIHLCDMIIAETEARKQRLVSLKKQNERWKRHMRKMNALTDRIDSEEFWNLPRDKRRAIIRQHVGHNNSRIDKIEQSLEKKRDKRLRLRRDEFVRKMLMQGYKKTEISHELNISRTEVYRILDRLKEEKLL